MVDRCQEPGRLQRCGLGIALAATAMLVIIAGKRAGPKMPETTVQRGAHLGKAFACPKRVAERKIRIPIGRRLARVRDAAT